MRIDNKNGFVTEPQQQIVPKPKCDWFIHICMNCIRCMDCGEVEKGFIPHACNAHTHGLEERYGHKEFQLVLTYHPKELMYILNTLGFRVQAGERFKDGDYVAGIYEDCDLKLVEFQENDKKILRVIGPDKYGKFPEDPLCMEEYKHQLLPLGELYVGKKLNH